MQSKYDILQKPGTLRTLAIEAILSQMLYCDSKWGTGAYYLNREQIRDLREVLGGWTEDVLVGALFRPWPERNGWWRTVSRTRHGTETAGKFRVPWDVLNALAVRFGEDADKAYQNVKFAA